MKVKTKTRMKSAFKTKPVLFDPNLPFKEQIGERNKDALKDIESDHVIDDIKVNNKEKLVWRAKKGASALKRRDKRSKNKKYTASVRRKYTKVNPPMAIDDVKNFEYVIRSLPKNAISVLNLLLSIRNESKKVYPSYKFIGDQVGFTERTVYKYVRLLFEKGILGKVTRWNNSNNFYFNALFLDPEYRIKLSDILPPLKFAMLSIFLLVSNMKANGEKQLDNGFFFPCSFESLITYISKKEAYACSKITPLGHTSGCDCDDWLAVPDKAIPKKINRWEEGVAIDDDSSKGSKKWKIVDSRVTEDIIFDAMHKNLQKYYNESVAWYDDIREQSELSKQAAIEALSPATSEYILSNTDDEIEEFGDCSYPEACLDGMVTSIDEFIDGVYEEKESNPSVLKESFEDASSIDGRPFSKEGNEGTLNEIVFKKNSSQDTLHESADTICKEEKVMKFPSYVEDIQTLRPTAYGKARLAVFSRSVIERVDKSIGSQIEKDKKRMDSIERPFEYFQKVCVLESSKNNEKPDWSVMQQLCISNNIDTKSKLLDKDIFYSYIKPAKQKVSFLPKVNEQKELMKKLYNTKVDIKPTLPNPFWDEWVNTQEGKKYVRYEQEHQEGGLAFMKFLTTEFGKDFMENANYFVQIAVSGLMKRPFEDPFA